MLDTVDMGDTRFTCGVSSNRHTKANLHKRRWRRAKYSGRGYSTGKRKGLGCEQIRQSTRLMRKVGGRPGGSVARGAKPRSASPGVVLNEKSSAVVSLEPKLLGSACNTRTTSIKITANMARCVLGSSESSQSTLTDKHYMSRERRGTCIALRSMYMY